MLESMPVWTIIMGIISFLATLVLTLVGFALRTQVHALVEQIVVLRTTIDKLTKADEQMSGAISRVERDLSDYKLHVAERYAKSERVEELLNHLFKRLDALPDMIRTEVERAARIIHKRIDDLHPNGHKE